MLYYDSLEVGILGGFSILWDPQEFQQAHKYTQITLGKEQLRNHWAGPIK